MTLFQTQTTKYYSYILSNLNTKVHAAKLIPLCILICCLLLADVVLANDDCEKDETKWNKTLKYVEEVST